MEAADLKIAVALVLAVMLLVSILVVRYALPAPPATDVPEIYKLTDWHHYHNYTEVVNLLLALNETHSEVVDVFPIGQSYYQPIYCVRLTNESDQRRKPEVLFVGYFHAREQITSELTLYFVAYTATNYGLNRTVTDLLNKCEVYVVVALNIDGFKLFARNDKARYNAGNVDLNRNFGYKWGTNGSIQAFNANCGYKPFSEPETQAVRNLVLAHNFTYSLCFHSGTELILYPWGYTREPAPDQQRFIEIAKGLSKAAGGVTYKQSSGLYITRGDSDDWLYGEIGIFAFTCEIYGLGKFRDDEENGLRYQFNPIPEHIMWTLENWLPVFFHILGLAANEPQE